MTGPSAHRRFSLEDQDAFAALSGDRNPMHMDAVVARRTQAGAPVVHGVHGLLWALDETSRRFPLDGLNAIKARFNRFLYLDVEAECRAADKDGSVAVEVFTEGQAATSVKLHKGQAAEPRLFSAQPAPPTPLPASAAPLAFEEMHGLEGHVTLPQDQAAVALFPSLSAQLGPEAVAALAMASGVVGMVCPGLHSVFSQLALSKVRGPVGPGLRWRTKLTDARARWVVLEIAGGGWEGELICIARQEPVEPPSMAALAGLVRADEFAGRMALVIGGSRGLGATTAKLVAAGGGRVVITYARGAQEAEDVAREIREAHGAQACRVLECDVLADVADALKDVGPLTHLYYFATPRISRSKARLYDAGVLADFLAVYVDGFAAVWDVLIDQRPLAVLYPSTVFIDERPTGMTEYAMAKAAAEQLCADLARRQIGVSLTVPRIPRVLTDQTATFPPLPTQDPVKIMLPLLRAQDSAAD